MKVHAMTGGAPLRDFQELARRAAAAGFSGLVVTEAGRTAYLSCAAAALSGADVDLATGVAVAFPRSPMVTATTAWELAEASGGRFRLGIGTQVRAHVERRYSAPFDPPGPRLREYVLALRACFRAFRGEEPLAFQGEHYRLSLLPDQWSPGPIPVPDPPIDVAAVNPWMLRMAGAVADGVHVHPLNTPTYLRETVLPNLAAGAEQASLDPSTRAVFLPVMTVVGDTEEERARWREASRTMIAFYGSTPNYAFVFEQLGRPGVTEALRTAQKAGDLAGMVAVVDDELLAHFVVEGTWDELGGAIVERCAPLAGYQVHVVLYHARTATQEPGDTFERFGAVAREAIRLSG
ncbi:MAG: TIGR03617 family F420-dependent LLM class oxidoreductase [Acidimicrobiia bacterium]|nr:TIGR03617 family F420-dependent LLM class oxidoreductase [Acidimicrobiia bacterium]